MLSRLLVLLGLRPPARTLRPRSVRTAARPAPAAAPGPEDSFPTPRGWHPDIVSTSTLAPHERLLFVRVEQRIRGGDLDLPRLPSSVQKLMALVANPKAEFEEIVSILSTDPALSSEAFKQANSALLGGAVGCDSLHDAVVRLGLRRLRSVVLAMSMRSAILRDEALLEFAEEIWRQALSVAHLSKHLAPAAGMDPDGAYLMGLTHDIGKVALLAMLSKEKIRGSVLSGAFLGTLFVRYHEAVGEDMAREWDLPAEVVAIAGHHHEPQTHPTHAREAALVSLAHRMDLLLSQGAQLEYRTLARAAEMDLLGIDEGSRRDLLSQAVGVAAGAEQAAHAA